MKIQLIIILVSLIILFMLCGFIIYYFLKRKKINNYSGYSNDKISTLNYTKEGSIYPIKYNDENKMDIIFINLKERRDRYKIFTDNYYNSDISQNTNLLVLNAINTTNISLKDVKKMITAEAYKRYLFYLKTKTRSNHKELTKGSLGCYLSHLEIYKYIVKKNKPCIVCEDDIEFSSDSYKKIIDSINEVKLINKNNDDFILLFNYICSKDRWKELNCVKIKKNIYKAYVFFSAACYYITPAIAQKILDVAIPISQQIDHFLGVCTQNNLFNILLSVILINLDRKSVV